MLPGVQGQANSSEGQGTAKDSGVNKSNIDVDLFVHVPPVGVHELRCAKLPHVAVEVQF